LFSSLSSLPLGELEEEEGGEEGGRRKEGGTHSASPLPALKYEEEGKRPLKPLSLEEEGKKLSQERKECLTLLSQPLKEE